MKLEAADLRVLLGRVVRRHRQALGISQEELAGRASLNRTYVTDIERGARNLSLATIDRLARALAMSLSRLMAEVDRSRGTTSSNGNGKPPHVDILFIEDNPDDVEQTLQAMRRARLANSIHVARTGIEALDYIFCQGPYVNRRVGEQPQLILLDLKLPGMDGMEVLRRIKSDDRTRSIPVVVLTGSADASDVIEARKLGAEACVRKPVSFHNLTTVTPELNFWWSLQRPQPPSRAQPPEMIGGSAGQLPC